MRWRGRGGRRSGAVLLMALVAWGAGSGVAMAHSTAAAGVVDMAATLGERELTVTISLPSGGTGALPIAVTTRGSAPEATMRVQAVPGATGDRATSEASVRIGPAQRSASTVLQIDRPGPWQIVLSDGAHVARLPLTLDAATAAGWVWAVRGGLAAAVIFAVAALVLRARRRPRWAVGLGGVAVAGVAVVVTAALLGGSTPAASPGAGGFIGATDPAAMPGMDMAGMGHNGMVMTSPAMSAGDMSAADMAGGAVVLGLRPDTPPVAGQAMQLGLDLTDGSTGNPVDDLAVHDDALIHLAVIGPVRRLWHVHPVRTAPGRYTVELTPSGPGRYGVFAELERSGGGHQVVRSAFTVEGTAGAAAPGSAGAGRRDVAGMTVDTTVASPVAGRPSRIALTFTDAGAPVGLQAWLGMAGHLMILGPTPAGPGAADAALDPADPTLAFAHVHDMTPPTATGYGPTTTFTYAFPRAGRYQLWAQVQRDWQLVTVPITVDVTAAPTA